MGIPAAVLMPTRGTNTLGQNHFMSAILVAFMIGGGFLTFQAGKNFAGEMAARSWLATPCVITRSQIVERSPYQCTLQYSYEFAGSPFLGQMLYQGYSGSEDYYDAQKIRSRHPIGSASICFVDPTNPHRAVLEQRSLWTGAVVLFPLLFVVVGAGGMYLIWRKPPPAGKSFDARHPKLLMGGFFAIFFMAGAVAFGSAFLPSIFRGLAARSWPQVPAVVTQVDVASHTSSGKHGSHTYYNVTVLFHYRYKGQFRVSSRYLLVKASSGDYSSQRQIADSLLRQKGTACFVNPVDPDDSVLDRSFGEATAVAGLLSSIFMGIGGLGLFWVLRVAHNQHRAKLQKHLSAAQRGPAELKPAMSSNLKFSAILVPVIIWNGLISIPVCVIISQWQSGRGEIAPTLFISVFVLVGLGMLVSAIRKSQMLFYPRAVIGVSHHPLCPGQPVELNWEMQGGSDRISRLTLRVAGYRSDKAVIGTSALRKLSPFWSLDLLNATRPAEIQAGHHAFAIPPDFAPASETDGLLWAILLDADISKPGDLQQEFPFQVTP
jgi:hypothetical protein